MKLRTIIIGGAILSVIAGFAIGKTVIANSPAPGSSADPVVSKSYVDKALQDKIAALETAVAELTVQAQALQTTINELQDKINKTGGKTTPSTPSSPTTPTTSTPTTPTTPSTPTTPASGTGGTSAVGKTCYIKSTNNYVNLRSAPSTSDSIIKKVVKGETMRILEEKNSWYRVTLDDNTVGWVASWVVEIR